MASVNARFRGTLELADNTSFAKAQTYGVLQTLTAQTLSTGPQALMTAATAAGKTFELGLYTTINWMMVENLSTTAGETVSVRWSNASDSTANRVTLPIANSTEQSFLIVVGVLPSTDLVLVSAAGTPTCRVTIFGV